MSRQCRFVTGMLGALVLVVGGATADLHAQRGAGAARGRPATAGHPGQGGDTHPGKPTGTTGRPTVGDQLSRNTQLTTRLQGLFPAGTDLQKASAGFKNLGQFVAAAHVSQNLDIPFETLKARMTGTDATSLGQAIHALKPAADAKAEERKAQRTADADIRGSGRS